jgi:hypothetical protein
VWLAFKEMHGQAGESLCCDERRRAMTAPCRELFNLLTQFKHPTQLQLLT